MNKWCIESVDPFAFVAFLFSLWLGFTGHVSWWTIGLIWATQIKMNMKLR